MKPRFKTVAAVGAGVALGIPAGLLALAGLILLVVWAWPRDSAETHARKAVQALFIDPSTLRRWRRVSGCTQVAADSEARIYRCRIVTATCVRTFRFAVSREWMYGAAPYSVSSVATDHPCRVPSD
jgi:hypothetical protein